MQSQLTRESLKEILNAGLQIPLREYVAHCRLNHLVTFYFFIKRLSTEASPIPLSSTELNDFIIEPLVFRNILPKQLFNPHGWWGRAWTNWNDPGKTETNFRTEYCTVLKRLGDKPYSYLIKPEWFEIAKQIVSELDSRANFPDS
jgi:hypothetical protein